MKLLGPRKVHINGLNFSQKPKNPIFGAFWDFSGPPDTTELFFKNWAPSFSYFIDYLTSGKKSGKTVKPILRSCVADGWTDGAKFIEHFL